MKTYENIPTSIRVIGTWTGVEDELTAKLTELGYVWRIQVDDELRLPPVACDHKPRLAVLGARIWEHSMIDKGGLVALDEYGRLWEVTQEYLDQNYREVTEP